MPADWTLSYSPTAIALPPSAALCAVTTESIGACRSEIGNWQCLSRAVCQLCLCSDLADMGLLHCHLVT